MGLFRTTLYLPPPVKLDPLKSGIAFEFKRPYPPQKLWWFLMANHQEKWNNPLLPELDFMSPTLSNEKTWDGTNTRMKFLAINEDKLKFMVRKHLVKLLSLVASKLLGERRKILTKAFILNFAVFLNSTITFYNICVTMRLHTVLPCKMRPLD